MKGGNPKWRIWDDVVTYCDLESFIEIYIHYTIQLSTYNIFQFECVYINLPLNLPMSGHRRKFTLLDFRPSYTNTVPGTNYGTGNSYKNSILIYTDIRLSTV